MKAITKSNSDLDVHLAPQDPTGKLSNFNQHELRNYMLSKVRLEKFKTNSKIKNPY